MVANYANRGKTLEAMLEQSNAVYYARGVAVVQKVATPTTVLWREGRPAAAFHPHKSTVDFIGHAKGRPLAFDAKETREETRFPLANIEPHQIEFLERWWEAGGVAFLIVSFAALNRTFLLMIWQFLSAQGQMLKENRRSIPFALLADLGTEVASGNGAALDYLAVLQKLGEVS